MTQPWRGIDPSRAPVDRMPASGTAAGAWGWLERIARNMVGLDYRSLAVTRIGFALCLLWVTWANGSQLHAFYTDAGVLPRAMRLASPGDFLGVSLHMAGGGDRYIAMLFVVQALFAAMMLVGYRTRLATIGAYVMLISMQNRHPVLLFGADIALRAGLFWMIFLPLGARFSIDSAMGRIREADTPDYLGVAGAAFVVQVCVIYVAGALMKIGPTWTTDHTAVSAALSLDVYSRPLGAWLGQFDGLTRVLTVFTLYVEKFAPFLFLFPIFSDWARGLGILLFAMLQIGFGTCMTMGTFGPIMVFLTLALLPSGFWTGFAEPLGARIAERGWRIARWWNGRSGSWWRAWQMRERGAASARRATPAPWATWLVPGLRVLRDGAVLGLLWVVLMWNEGNLLGEPWHLSPRLTQVAYNLGLNQRWDMFSPNPQQMDGWFVVAGTLRNGQTVDMLTGEPVSFEKPKDVAGSYGPFLWMGYLISFWFPGTSYPDQFAQYMGREWNAHHADEEQVTQVEVNMMSYTTLPKHTKTPVERSVLWTQNF